MTTDPQKYGWIPKVIAYVITGLIALTIYWLITP